jgi:hypothetical protein
MRAAKLVAVLAIAALCVGAFGAEALAGKKKKTRVTFFSGSPKVGGGGKVTARGALSSASACEPARGMRLFMTDAAGAVLSTLGGSTSDAGGNYSLRGQVPASVPKSAPVYVQVKAVKRTAGKFVCRAGFSPVIQVR